jgi:hypothetical protein
MFDWVCGTTSLRRGVVSWTAWVHLRFGLPVKFLLYVLLTIFAHGIITMCPYLVEAMPKTPLVGLYVLNLSLAVCGLIGSVLIVES